MLPDKFVLRMKDILGDSLEAFLRSYDAPPERAVRVNLKKISPERFLAAFPYKCEKIPYAQNGFYVDADADEKIGSHPLHHAGAFYAQEPSASTSTWMMSQGSGMDAAPSVATNSEPPNATRRFSQY